jgi:carboxylate-amine ligase
VPQLSEAHAQLGQIRDALVRCADKLNIAVVGGGTHPFQQWHQQRIYDKPRFQELSQLYGYLSKQFTIFGQHVHMGCPDADTALCMLHGMSATSRTSSRCRPPAPSCRAGHGLRLGPAELGVRLSAVGRAPCVLSWGEFEQYFDKMTRTGVVRA